MARIMRMDESTFLSLSGMKRNQTNTSITKVVGFKLTRDAFGGTELWAKSRKEGHFEEHPGIPLYVGRKR